MSGISGLEEEQPASNSAVGGDDRQCKSRKCGSHLVEEHMLEGGLT